MNRLFTAAFNWHHWMNHKPFVRLSTVFVAAVVVLSAVACEKPHVILTTEDYQPIRVIAVDDITGIPNPGGPIVEIILKSVSNESITSLDVTLNQPNALNKGFDFDFGVSAVKPFLPGNEIRAKRSLIGGAWGTDVDFYLEISGKQETGAIFFFRWDGPDIGKVLDIKVETGNGDSWASGVVLTEPKFTVGVTDRIYPGFGVVLAPKGAPCIYFSGVFTNNSGKGGYVSFWTDPLHTLTWAGLPGRAELYLNADESGTFNIPLTYSLDVKTIIVGSHIKDMPSP